ncbi:hypothetical protein HER10_EVM0006207 [Colletotrichum scovillei]|uniref:Uncharacterized protein n=1 Tax=Colletotrichum scovillei TaxID=1209932 RepID=A0A9P7UD64_9PEZI|nr:uncharacterized protein HER10_EVM0006207 [Colletotrichum scovillei]KAF4783102.1 hypothetical protein HER10_EVM0006207 [Colletotrichum scovillei]KAG7051318.1 hypothetical protein JMJ77_0001942 [Colletotrichum scovillei]KAG7070356.1 hypothetical protein JMJ76_0001609 [Colletotrichum scovillei]KAG7078663.1 hypothetical protein JMJ78_0002332 [Colletotrichum scovillei]
MCSFHFLLSFALFLSLALSASDAVAAAHHIDRRQVHLGARQTPGQEETRTRGTCTQMSNKCNLTGRDAQVCPADYNRCPFDGASCVLIEPKGDSSRKPEVRCGYLGSTRS